MTVFFMEWESIGNEDFKENMEQLGHSIRHIPFIDDSIKYEQIVEKLHDELKSSSCDFVFSFNYYPEISKACSQLEIKYVSWVYDSPHISLYSYTVLNNCNYIFLFDLLTYQELLQAGIKTVYYLPLAVNTYRLVNIDKSFPMLNHYQNEVAFVGSLYSEKKHCLYDRLLSASDYVRGYLDGIIQAQKNVHGYLFISELLTEEIMKELQKVYPVNPDSEYALSPKAIYAEYVLARQVTALERKECLARLSQVAETKLFTHEKPAQMEEVIYCGPCDYYNEMPKIIRSTKINLNISLRSIKTGIPLRSLDIMGNGGFLITNYQEEMLDYFEPNKEFVYYNDIDELIDLTTFYLEHTTERELIARNGCKKVRREFSYKNQLTKMLEIVENS